MPTEKRCSRCRITQPISEFTGDRSTADGYNRTCKLCRKMTRLDPAYRFGKERECRLCGLLQPVDQFRPKSAWCLTCEAGIECIFCHVKKPWNLKNFPIKTNRRSCKACLSEQRRNSYDPVAERELRKRVRTAEKELAYQRRYHQRHTPKIRAKQLVYLKKRRATDPVWRKKMNDRCRVYYYARYASPVELAALLESQNGLCANPACKKRLTESNREIDHIMPIALGGQNELSNFQFLCRHCNATKSDQHPDEWLRAQLARIKP